jgi:hypothetical protein
VVLQGNQWQVQAWVAVEEEQQWQVHGLRTTATASVVILAYWSLLGLIEASARSTDATTSGSACRCADHRWTAQHPPWHARPPSTLSWQRYHPRESQTCWQSAQGTCHRSDHRCGQWSRTHGRCHRCTVHSLLDVLHREVGVALVHRLEEGYLRAYRSRYTSCAP